MVIATNTTGYSYSKCCQAPLLLKGTSMGLFCSKCKKEIFSYIILQKPIKQASNPLTPISSMNKTCCERCNATVQSSDLSIRSFCRYSTCPCHLPETPTYKPYDEPGNVYKWNEEETPKECMAMIYGFPEVPTGPFCKLLKRHNGKHSPLPQQPDKGELPWRKNLKELVEKYPSQLENALDSAWLQGFEDKRESTDKGELPENWEKEIQAGYEKLIAIIHEAHDNGLISGRLYKKFGDNFNKIIRNLSRELPPAIGVLQVIEKIKEWVEKHNQYEQGVGPFIYSHDFYEFLDEVISKLSDEKD